MASQEKAQEMVEPKSVQANEMDDTRGESIGLDHPGEQPNDPSSH